MMYTLLVTSVILTFIVIITDDIIEHFTKRPEPVEYWNYVLFGIVTFSNYFLFIAPGTYKEIIPERRHNIYTIIFIVLVLLFVIIVATLKRNRLLY